jgi:penicillin-binding protein 2
MEKINPYDEALGRIRLIALAIFVALLSLSIQLWTIQVVQGDKEVRRLNRQSIRIVRLSGTRGRIFDRHGNILVDNRPSYSVAVYLELFIPQGFRGNAVDKIDSLLDELSTVLGLERQLTREQVFNHYKQELSLPLIAWRDIDAAAIARLSESQSRFPGVDIVAHPVRVYPHGKTAAHILGYVQNQDPEKLEGRFNYTMPEVTGRRGIERSMNDVLTGRAGFRWIRVDALGFRFRDQRTRDPGAGSDVYLTLDLKTQRLAEDALGNRKGAVVVMDVTSGEVLAMASYPAFNPNDFIPSISTEKWNRLLNPDRPLMNRATNGQYPPGSLFKPLVAISSLENHRVDPELEVNCQYAYPLGNQTIHCWYKLGHGPLKLRKAIEQSCNCFFFEMGLQTGYDYIYHMADAVGIGHRVGIEIEEQDGRLPSRDWKRQHIGHNWWSGDTANISIGQGYLEMTPLQVALMTSALATGGRVYRPSLVYATGSLNHDSFHRKRPEMMADLKWSAGTMELVRGGMYDVVESPTGTGRKLKIQGVHMAGKTGTAEYGSRNNRKRHAWMATFAPFEDPKYAAVMIVENAESGGGSVVAPLLHDLMKGVLGMSGEERP